MVVNPLKAFLFIAGGATAAVGTAYVSGALDPYLVGQRAAAVAALPETAAPIKPAAPKGERLPQQATPPGTATPAPDAAAPAVIAPSFDLVRAESDGSIVVAGKAAPESMVEIVAGAQVLGSTKAGAAGDFAIVLNEPLKPGGHELVLRSTTADKVVATSPETAVVSIPDQEDGQVLALVEKPGEPSKLITVPEATKPAEQAGAAATPEKAPAVAAAPSEAPPADDKVAAATLEQPAPGPQPAAPAADTAKPAEPAASAKPAEPAGEPKIAVDAVEIEGRKVFVAGAADAGRRVRVYANDILLGEAVASPGGRFLIETERDLPVGDYIVRADALDPDDAKVVARAAVPFQREPGEAVAAVAPDSQDTAPATAAQPATQPTSEAPPAAQQPAGETAGESQPDAAIAPEQQAATGEADATAPKLQHVDGSVIIRRGDTLWRISRRVYGHGVRYSTIYLANQDQIADPDRIWPGQVFNVPEKTPEGDAADMTAVKEQVPPPAPKKPL
ncbi:Nucleoid-associated protein YgaU, contains BON and LysM domains [Mesorhizobium albiziae]|uniref:Nucleoid-associated protein YgaU, contains BON and LysM domains n=1 Tax=Neomesorhizobium albiziae TaxID=335020 RepID=A0A1I4DFD6_9HYPH|nr:LysM peptidoglycan-binding domain-containing protein [Mesorhizobium albiziae]GLS32424.1 peptidoglycan-binding protein LysM [Mesorhizobium albiziae]SFK92444.1 Nucleoid-associated protein YgaU, contains BON and LysM domains [Mesorhizobium albiziae]